MSMHRLNTAAGLLQGAVGGFHTYIIHCLYLHKYILAYRQKQLKNSPGGHDIHWHTPPATPINITDIILINR